MYILAQVNQANANNILDDPLGVVPFDVDESYYNPVTSTPAVSGPHILRKNAAGHSVIHRRRKADVSIYYSTGTDRIGLSALYGVKLP